MGGRLAFLSSVRWRLTLAYVAVLAVLLGAFGIYQYVSLRQSLISARVGSLQDDMTTARTLLARAGQTAAARGRVLCSSSAGTDLVARSVATTVAATSGHTVDVIVYDQALAPVAQAPQNASLPHLNPADLSKAVSGTRSGPEIVPGSDGEDQLVVGFPVRQAVNTGHTCGVAQLSTAMEPLQRVLNEELILLAAGGGFALVLATVFGVLLTGRALGPLRRLTTTSRRLAGGDLRARSGVEGRRDEIGTLARSFDDMAERIEQSFTAQQESEERTRRFIADASHELRTPVTALSGYIDVIRRGATPSPEALDAALAAMAREASRMRTLVLDLLTLARLDAEPSAAPGTTDLTEVITHHLDEEMPGMPALVTRRLDRAVVTTIDRNSLDTIVRNLMVNACKYAPAAAQTWTAWETGDRACFAVHDMGPGIAGADLPHVFERFYRGEKTRAREEGGSGLGLSIVMALVRAHGGDVAISSSEGAGTTVTVELPRATQQPPQPPPPPVTVPPPTG
ncbi:MAG: HAMP domain-containing histidine kinase [Candidatus Dormibacteraeota bacterium]|nr:HAMP domain-containing histidine kinase [Candidatus Dormibacteraeota bacterium]